MKSIRLLILVLLGLTFLLSLESCSKIKNINIFKKNNKTHSSATGWEYNNPEWGGFFYNNDYTPTLGPGLVLVHGGTFVMGQTQQDVMGDWNNTQKRVTVATFYMDETEVRNVDYREYLHWLQRVYGATNPRIVKKAIPDTLVWRDELAYNEPYIKNYFRHPAYSEYPVVGVTWEQAKEYAIWRSDRVNEMLLIKNRIIKSNTDQKGAENFNVSAYLSGQYDAELDEGVPDYTTEGEIRHARWDDGIMIPDYRLPTEAEWEYAAYGLIAENERFEDKKIYPWAGKSIRNDGKRKHKNKQKDRGQMMANFVRGRGDYMGIAGDWNDKGDLTLPVKSFWPNDFGLYCMAGNVNEWVADVYRPLTFEDTEEFNPFRGNIFTAPAVDENGNTLPKDSLGRMPIVIQKDEDIRDRYNYKKADARNYRDGDAQSRISEGGNWNNPEETTKGSEAMYYKGHGTSREGISSLINDKSRVYKGGSWKDRAYWLSPSMRRFLDQKKSRNDIGFRCAMSHIGPSDVEFKSVQKSGHKKKKKRKSKKRRSTQSTDEE